MLVWVVLGLQGCQSNQGSSQDHGSVTNRSANQLPKFAFKNVKVSHQDVAQADKKYATISISEFRLNAHKLYLAQFNNDMLFEFDKSDTQLINRKDIATFAKFYRDGKLGKYLYVVGHTDATGSKTYNQSLSARRAWSVASLLSKNGVNADNIKLVPAGEILPHTTNKTAKGRAKNRRVEILSADSRALAISYFRQIDCTKVDPACEKALLPVLDIKQKNGELFIQQGKDQTLATLSPELNKLSMLDKSLRTNSSDVDVRMGQHNDHVRLSKLTGKTRKKLAVPLDVRKMFNVNQQVRKPLLLPKKYLFIKKEGE